MSSTAKGPTPENKSTKRQNPDNRLLSFCRLSIGVEGFAVRTAVDRWNQMILGLTGESVPPLPALPGHEIVTAPFQAVPHAGTFGPPVRFRE